MENMEEILLKRNWRELEELVLVSNKKATRSLVNRIYIKDGLRFWRAVEALGVAAALEEKQKKDSSVELVRRYFWSLNEESGGNAWNASEAIGSIMAYNPKECGHFNWMYANLLEDESLQEGVLWGLLNLSINAPEVVDPLVERVYPFLKAQDVSQRGLAVWIFTLMKAYPLAEERWEIGEELHKVLVQDKEVAEIYLEGDYYHFSISELLGKEILTFYAREYEQEDFTWNISVASSQKGLCWVGLGTPEKEEAEIRSWAQKRAPGALIIPRTLPNQKIMKQLEEYFSGDRQEFALPLDPRGTDFQLKVWEELRRIPYGETCSYGEIAQNVGNPKGPRAVGLANNKNPMAIITPCHRVVGKKGDLVGYASGLDYKERLLNWEAAHRHK
ncbi:MAG TPA: methylated-DNA--[protein]-cysteine S-methyltransferase [Desulfitobacterium dehalogenans]|uniref:Methylated-DNA--protein-cysteine methyltransferase n=1 Tax=Desulfitobacterium dehalogenans TaxID=36854 RepID=A0A7C6Z785_9FIRM|nr:methylated-DNA--[protein]-cysteine S-methyltransferase [Desulfitobacterium dehalogenans]